MAAAVTGPHCLELIDDAVGAVREQPGEVEEAELIYRELLADRPRFAEAYANLGIVLQKQKKVDDAFEAFQTSLSLRPDFLRQALLNISSTGKGKLWLNINQAKEQLGII